MRPWHYATTAVALVLTLAACQPASTTQPESDDPGQPDRSEQFPVTIEHAYGSTTIETQPERVATVAWANHEVPLALGVVPVGMARATWGDDDGDGVLPWVRQSLDDLGAQTPVLFDESDGIDFEAVADTQPDVILASYSGLTQEEYDTLTQIAPVVAYPETPWATSYEEMIELNSRAIGLEAQGEELTEELHEQVQQHLGEHPELAGATTLFAYIDTNDLSQIGFYTLHDTRPGFLEQIGLGVPEHVRSESESADAFYATVSAEAADEFDDVDLLITYGDDALAQRMQADPLLGAIPAVRDGAIVTLTDDTPLAAVANPTPLSIPWGIAEYFDALAQPLTASDQ